MSLNQDQLVHNLMSVVGIRAPMTAAALLQLIAELRLTKVLDDRAVERIKQAMAREACQVRPAHFAKSQSEAEIGQQLDRLLGATEPPVEP